MLKGKSRARAQGRFLQPPDKSEAPAAILDEDEAEQIKKRPKRHASVYDAVAGSGANLTTFYHLTYTYRSGWIEWVHHEKRQHLRR